MNSINPVNNIMISIFLMVVGLFLSTAVSVMAFYFKQLKNSIDQYKDSVEKRMKEGEERFDKIESDFISFKSEVYKDYVSKPDLIRIIGTFECKFRDLTDLIEKSFHNLKERGEKI
jgi:hypothetical protein